MRYVLFTFGLAALLGGCAASGKRVRIGPERPAKPEGCEITMYLEQKPAKAYTVVGQVEAHGTDSFSELLPVLSREACALGADAIVDVKYSTNQGYTAVANMQGGVGGSYSNFYAVALAVVISP